MFKKNSVCYENSDWKFKFNSQRNIQCSMIKISPTGIQQLFFEKFSIQDNIQYSIMKMHSTENSTFNGIFNIQ